MTPSFINRKEELRNLTEHLNKGHFVVIKGRRRVGKTRLIRHFIEREGGVYSQAIEGTKELQIEQVALDFGFEDYDIPKNWQNFFRILTEKTKKSAVVCFDEFPLLVGSDKSFLSTMQKWIDHQRTRHQLVIVSGSSHRLMNAIFNDSKSPLFDRADHILTIRPMSYKHFCQACKLNPLEADSFRLFSMVGGVPKYWEWLLSNNVLENCDHLFFSSSSVFEREPDRVLRDEAVEGLYPRSILEAVGRGACRSGEIAARLNMPATQLSKSLQLLVDSQILVRSVPYGESVRSSKRTEYHIQDPTLRFWYSVFSPHQSRWHGYPPALKKQLIDAHVGFIFEQEVRALFPGGSRYWEGNVEFDLIAPEPKHEHALTVGECKWADLSSVQLQQLKKDLEIKFEKSTLANKIGKAKIKYEIIDRKMGLKKLAESS